MNKTTSTTSHQPQERHDRLLKEWEHDTYKSKLKPEGPAVCSGCGAIYMDGRWQWHEIPTGASQALCPACQRIQDKVPAGFLTVSGEFFTQHHEEIMNLVRNVEQKERAEHPLKRIIDMEFQQDGMLITFTDPHLARGVGDALHHAYKGELDFAYQAEERILRASWRR